LKFPKISNEVMIYRQKPVAFMDDGDDVDIHHKLLGSFAQNPMACSLGWRKN
jgi:hypothetical protein